LISKVNKPQKARKLVNDGDVNSTLLAAGEEINLMSEPATILICGSIFIMQPIKTLLGIKLTNDYDESLNTKGKG